MPQEQLESQEQLGKQLEGDAMQEQQEVEQEASASESKFEPSFFQVPRSLHLVLIEMFDTLSSIEVRHASGV